MLDESIRIVIMSIEKKYGIQVGFEHYLDSQEFEQNIICKLYNDDILIHKFQINKRKINIVNTSRIKTVIDIINNEIKNNLPELLI